jgi:hypothetical protein
VILGIIWEDKKKRKKKKGDGGKEGAIVYLVWNLAISARAYIRIYNNENPIHYILSKIQIQKSWTKTNVAIK